jgi:uncharacterized protein with PQ loop repeat
MELLSTLKKPIIKFDGITITVAVVVVVVALYFVYRKMKG